MSTDCVTSDELLVRARKRLEGVGIPGARLDSEVLLAHVMGVGRTDIVARGDDAPAPAQAKRFAELVSRRALHEPVAYLVGGREFYGLAFTVNSDVLIPRPESELLVERALTVLGEEGGRVADVGTGSGNLAVSVAVTVPRGIVTAIDNSDRAIRIARKNAEYHGVADRVGCVCGDLFEPLVGTAQFDVVLANLPYVPDGTPLMPDVELFEPGGALRGGPDGLDVIRRFVAALPAHLVSGGQVGIEFDGDEQGRAIRVLLEEAGIFGTIETMKDLAGLPRVIWGIRE